MEHKTKAVEVSFLKKTKWTGTATRMLTFPGRRTGRQVLECMARYHG